jgi:hypothetical protein
LREAVLGYGQLEPEAKSATVVVALPTRREWREWMALNRVKVDEAWW